MLSAICYNLDQCKILSSSNGLLSQLQSKCSKMNIMPIWFFFNSLPNDKIFLDWSKLKAFADDKINVNKKIEIGLGRVENIVGKGENAGFSYNVFKMLLFPDH